MDERSCALQPLCSTRVYEGIADIFKIRDLLVFLRAAKKKLFKYFVVVFPRINISLYSAITIIVCFLLKKSINISMYAVCFSRTKSQRKKERKKFSGCYSSRCWLISSLLCLTTAQLTACQRRLEKNP